MDAGADDLLGPDTRISGRRKETSCRSLEEVVEAFLAASVGCRVGRAARLLAERPEIAEHSLATAVVLGDAGRVKRELAADPGLTSMRDPRTGWTALHAVCASRWHRDPARAEGLLAVTRLLLDAGADPNALSNDRHWSPLPCAVASADSGRANEPIVRLLLDRGVTVQDHDLYLAGFAGSWCVRMLLERVPNVAEIAEQALGAPISSGDVDAVRLLLDAGADPTRYHDGDGHPAPVIPEALAEGAPTEMIELLLSHGADAAAPGLDGRSPYRLATAVMLDVGLPIGARGDGHGATAPHAAAHSGSVETVTGPRSRHRSARLDLQSQRPRMGGRRQR